MFQSAAYTDIGPRKDTNQDSCIVDIAMTKYGHACLLAVCDGVGGLAAGEIASYSIVKWLERWFEGRLSEIIDEAQGRSDRVINQTQYEWNIGLDDMNDAILHYGNAHEKQLGTTCSAMLLYRGEYVIAHVGDSRVYKFADGSMDILTQDQTWVAQEVARGAISPESARFHPKRNVILQAIGTQPDLQPVFSQGRFSEGDVFMACCDGFRNELFDDELTDTFCAFRSAQSEDMHAGCKELVELVLQRGERDNITVAVVSCQGVDELSIEEMPSDGSPTVPLGSSGETEPGGEVNGGE